MRVTLVIHSLNCGGAERVMSIMANYWAARESQITLLTFDDGSTPPFYDFDRRVRHIPLALEGNSQTALHALERNVKRVSALRRAIISSNPEAVISFMDRTNVMTLLATRGTKMPVIVSERSDPASNSPGGLWTRLRHWTYPRADVVVVQTKDALRYFSRKVQSRACIIPNPVLPPATDRNDLSFEANRPLAVAMGRLVRAKGFDLLLRAFGRISQGHPDWTLAILGDGPLHGELQRLSDGLNIRGRVLFPGRVKSPQDVLSRADLFVMSSRFEGFPNALCEAMSHGLPVIATDCPSGPRAIIRDGVDGLLIPNGNVERLAAAMDRVMRDEVERKRLGLQATEVIERFAVDKIMRKWETALTLASGKRPSRLHNEAAIAGAR